MRMPLEQVRDRLAQAKTMEYSEQRALADAIDAHLAQPAQAVDVEKVREVIAHLYSFRFKTPPTWAHLDNAADKLTRAIGNAHSVDVERVIVEWRVLERINGSKLVREAFKHCADQLTAALQEKGNAN